uniref:Secreted protein n=1 Tax=Meloidogyne hapla TaxID=6305 RepID=A0A1I8BTN1_MELHA
MFFKSLVLFLIVSNIIADDSNGDSAASNDNSNSKSNDEFDANDVQESTTVVGPSGYNTPSDIRPLNSSSRWDVFPQKCKYTKLSNGRSLWGSYNRSRI